MTIYGHEMRETGAASAVKFEDYLEVIKKE